MLATPAASGTGLYQLRVPWLVAPRGTSNVKPTPTTLKFAAGSSKTLNLSNSGIHSGNADFYALGQTSPNDGLGAADLRANGVQVLPGAALGMPSSDRGLIFAVNTYGAASNPAQIEMDTFIDTNNDNHVDFDVVNADFGAVTAGAFNGQLATFVFTYPNFDLVDIWIADGPMNGSTQLLVAAASDLGLASGHGSFQYATQSFNVVNGDADGVNFAKFDAYAPPVATGDFVVVPANSSTSLALTIDRTNLAATPVSGWLVVTMDDAIGAAQADTVSLSYTP